MAITQLHSFEPPTEPRLIPLASILSELYQDAAAAHEDYLSGTPRGPRIFLPALSKALGGAWAPGLHFMHGVPGAGKTPLALQIAAEAGVPTLYLTVEIAVLELVRRLIARLSGQYLGRLRGELSAQTTDQLARAAFAKAPHLHFVDATQVWASPQWLEEVAIAVRGEHRYVFIVVDSLHSWAEGADTGVSEYETLNSGVASLRRLAGKLSCPVLAITERNRLAMDKGGLSAAAGSRKIEYGAETILDLTGEKDAQYDESGEKAVTLRVHKNRRGEGYGEYPLMFHGALQRFREW